MPTNLLQPEIIQWGNENRQSGIDTHDPSKGKAIIRHAQKHGRFGDHLPRTHERLPECTPLVARMPLLDADETLYSRFPEGSFGEGDFAVVVGFVDEEDDEQKAHACQDGDEPEAPVPFCAREDEGCEHRAEIGGENDEAGPDVDFSSGRC